VTRQTTYNRIVSTMTRSPRLWVLALVILTSVILPGFAQQVVTVSALLQNPERYDGQTITVTGQVTAYRERVSARGNAYTTFRLLDRSAQVSVFVWKHAGLGNGANVRITGKFQREKHVGRYTFYNEIQAARIDRL
jgi:DNA polymerase III alpha subunit